jgi:hypothetical protein
MIVIASSRLLPEWLGAQVSDDYTCETHGAYAKIRGGAALLPIGKHEWQLVQADRSSYMPGLLTLILLSS